MPTSSISCRGGRNSSAGCKKSGRAEPRLNSVRAALLGVVLLAPALSGYAAPGDSGEGYAAAGAALGPGEFYVKSAHSPCGFLAAGQAQVSLTVVVVDDSGAEVLVQCVYRIFTENELGDRMLASSR